eukprot:CAMPEP_0171933674 /NCGR_PEP_ID=MMETSP0993-20121228/31419_1 /TAXON_ID=483369 /ORGANISM="non described non described, Strain CCMP2098" /LENGTH=998 /DNA_ID=CAMNT_0012574233 /DNA_START=224 /DNA_END=3220 /DNA_ORIENTATION=-
MGRALPDIRDGLKPVHRRILYAMHELKLNPSGGYRKCARVVGEVLGKFHPHGDLSVYDALVRMAQDFTMAAPLVQGHGNFGSLDSDPPAAMRYTECKLAGLASEALLQDINLNTVDFTPNFDGNENEPVILPSRLPILLLNGAAGIAVGMATNIPPHNLGELCDGLDALIDAKLAYHIARDESTNRSAVLESQFAVSDAELFKLIPAPDFPTGGIIMGTESARKLYATGHGGVVVRAKTSIEPIEQNGKKRGAAASSATPSSSTSKRMAIIVHEVPYQCNKAALLERMAQLVNEKRLLGVSDLRDESDRDGVRVVIELKRDAVPGVVLNNLFQKTGLQTSFSGNFLALRHGGTSPGRFTLRQGLEEFLEFRFDTVRRRARHQLEAASLRAHVLDGLLVAIRQIDDVISVIRAEPSRAAAKAKLMNPEPPLQALSSNQSEAVLGLQLGRLTSLDESNLVKEREGLEQDMATLGALLESEPSTWKVIRDELAVLKKKYAVPRRTEVDASGDSGVLETEDLILNERSLLVVTASGYIKRMPLDSGDFSSSTGRGTRGKAGAKLASTSPTASASAAPSAATSRGGGSGAASAVDSQDDEVGHFLACNDHDTVLFITSTGRVLGLKAWQVPMATRTARGSPLPALLGVSKEESTMASVIAVSSFGLQTNAIKAKTRPDGQAATTTDSGDDKEGEEEDEGDEEEGGVVDEEEEGDAAAQLATGTEQQQHLVLVTRQGWIKKTPLHAFARVVGKKRGLVALSLGQGDSVQWARLCGTPTAAAAAATTSDEDRNPDEEEEKVKAAAEVGGQEPVEVDSIILGTRLGFAAHFSLADNEVRATGRTSRGVRAMKLREGDEIVDMDVLTHRHAEGKGADGEGGSEEGKSLLVITANGYGKRTPVSEFARRHRKGMGVTATKFKAPKKTKGKKSEGGGVTAPDDRLACLRACAEDDEVMITTDAGVIVRQRVSAISRQSRAATGVLVTRLDPGTFITDIALVPSTSEQRE